MTDPIRPALSESEWESTNALRAASKLSGASPSVTRVGRGQLLEAAEDAVVGPFVREMKPTSAGRLHATAALCLNAQHFGFTWAAVDLLRDLAQWNIEGTDHGASPQEGRLLASLADRIEALLPPREP